ncbi:MULTISPECIES: isochorismatase family protein [unclassified Mesorhizobium]|uniref:isochorismatase family protein n=1 Tax=unclassified Mesorhizobium TaxID=325217 RepID=UPI000BAE8129|nr:MULTISPECIES: isochorismatase family protein [unclassified Mesorhizobium]TGT56864.1 isochorismatase family protein [Mesorhizobium sp. M00.F.Ca.ET.170.01.1.1]AZO08632.1 isochorismatase family protein [Mesorhizobium sp. M3A.F.Ca.ET.080.04.2.1]PBB85511.1 isochorismatase [Mesorhizobium sp. WSM3876]RWB71749.1 MAG: isochorismatase family protein [Mesorhizobium sp.]RWB84999.1 MAG: isochorismatase family protein [Mesorhizobium sp.]
MPDTIPSAVAPLIVIDLQTGMFDGRFDPPIHDADTIAERARALIDWARRTGRKVAFVRHDGPAGDPLAPGASGWPVWPQLGQAADEPTFGKTVRNAFSNAELGQWVAGQGARDVVLIGAQTDFCVAATVQGAFAEGLAVTVVSDAHSTLDTQQEKAPDIIARHNDAFATQGARMTTTAALVGG